MTRDTHWVLWSSKLSPFGLKIDLLLRQAGVPFKWFPQEGGFVSALRYQLRLSALKAGRQTMTWPLPDHEHKDLQELPLVPYLFGPKGENLYDSSAVGDWLNNQDSNLILIPSKDTAEGFVTLLVDEAMDEFGLYLAHHNRWVKAAVDNNAGQRLAAEMRPLHGPLGKLAGRIFPPRQVRRLPYLFSVADGDSDYAHLPGKIRPPVRAGFPATHKLLDAAFGELLAALETVLEDRDYLMGDRMSLADASILGQLGMNRTDPGAWKIISEQAPNIAKWIDLHYLKDVEVKALHETGEHRLFDDLQPLLAWCCRYFVPLMQQNYRAYKAYQEQGETLFNETAFDQHRSLYQGKIAGRAFKSVAKTFQVKVWMDLHATWQRLPDSEKEKLQILLPAEHGMATLGGTTEILIEA